MQTSLLALLAFTLVVSTVSASSSIFANEETPQSKMLYHYEGHTPVVERVGLTIPLVWKGFGIKAKVWTDLVVGYNLPIYMDDAQTNIYVNP